MSTIFLSYVWFLTVCCPHALIDSDSVLHEYITIYPRMEQQYRVDRERLIVFYGMHISTQVSRTPVSCCSPEPRWKHRSSLLY